MSDSEEQQETRSEDLRDAGELMSCAYYYVSRGELAEAFDAAIEARDLFDELREVDGSAEARLVMGFINYQQQEFKAALPLLASAQQQFASLESWHRQAATLFLLAHCHLGLERPSKAVYALKLADKLMKERADTAHTISPHQLLPDWPTLTMLVTRLLAELSQHTDQTE